MLNSIKYAERMYGRPVYCREIHAEIPQVSLMPSLRPVFVWYILFDLYQNDEILADKYLDKFSLNPKL